MASDHADAERPTPAGAGGSAADDGSVDPGVAAALAAYGHGDGGAADVLTALAQSRLLVPVVAVLDEAGPVAEKSSHMATVSTTGDDGRRGMLAFTCVETMHRWDADARPVPVSTRSAAEAALADGADALVLDLAGPVVFAVDAPELRTLASGWRTLGPWAGAGPAEDRAEAADRPRGRVGVSTSPTARLRRLAGRAARAAGVSRRPVR